MQSYTNIIVNNESDLPISGPAMRYIDNIPDMSAPMMDAPLDQVVNRKRAFFKPLLHLLICLVITQLAIAETGFPNNEELARLKRGEILIQTIENEKPGVTARATALVRTDADSVWNIIGYCKNGLIYMHGLKTCEMLEGDQFDMIVHHRVRNSWFSPMLDYKFRAQRNREGYGSAKLISGNLNVLNGYWQLMPLEGEQGVLVVHEISIQTRFPAPEWLVRRSLKHDLPDMLACIRGLAQSPAQFPVRKKSVQLDLNRCPGEIPPVAN